MDSRKLVGALIGLVVLLLAIATTISVLRSSELKEELKRMASEQAALEAKLNEANARLEKQAALMESTRAANARERARLSARTVEKESARPDDESDTDDTDSAGGRVMRNFGEMMENPRINKMMAASQRATLEVLYEGLIAEFALNDEEKEYFLDLLMKRQMAQMELGMKMMSGDVSETERSELSGELKDTTDGVKQELEVFLNDAEDYKALEYFEATMGERMAVSGLGQKMEEAGVPLAEGKDRELIDMMHDVRVNHTFSTDLNNTQNAVISRERFSKENLDKHFSDLEQVNVEILRRAGALLTPNQLAVFEKEQEKSLQLQRSQLEMAAKMFGGERGR